ncbi:MAG: RdgB/HAM1 family non-canonical purine NTP pyrophosphatase [Deltaproteobacteria bacterium]|nr:RdgB/HAM1 family non-canonical purine NTP pyrophosphatase [Deltaproteobacteria bacterium]
MIALSLVAATANRGKLAEIRLLLGKLPVQVLSTREALGRPLAVVEDGASFEENALKKARAVAEATGLVTLADDSGLEVDALGGRPGVRSARFAGERATDAENNRALLDCLQDVEDGERGARFRCVIALVDPWHPGEEILVGGRCDGRIARKPSGTGGFGYDPLFIVDGLGRTLAELGEQEKNRTSHRGRALAALRPELERRIGERLAEAARIAGAGG